MDEDSGWVAIVANPGSGSGPNRERVDHLAAALEARGFEARVIWHPVETAQEFENGGCRCIVACGGDGTVNRVLNAPWVHPLAVLPLGTENLFARHFGFDGDIDRLVGFIVRGDTHAIDVGYAGERKFSLMVSAGFDAEVIHRLDRWRTDAGHVKRVRHASYARPILTALMKYSYPVTGIEVGGKLHEGALAMVFSAPPYAFRLELMPDARADSGRLHWFVFQRPGAFRMLGFVNDVLRGRHLERTDVVHGQAEQLRITGDGVPVQLDGEAVAATPIDVRIAPGTLQVVKTR